MGMFEKIFGKENTGTEISEDEYYSLGIDEAYKDSNSEGNKMILLEPRAYSESQQIADHLKKRNTVVVNLKRVTQEQAKRIVDFLSGTLYAIGGNMQRLGNGIYLCTPKNVNVEGHISEEDSEKKQKSKIEDEMDMKNIKEYEEDVKNGNVELYTHSEVMKILDL